MVAEVWDLLGTSVSTEHERCLMNAERTTYGAVFRDFTVTNISQGVAVITQCTSYNNLTGDCDTSAFQISNVTWANITGTVANALLGSLQCSGAAPCTDIVIKGVEGLTYFNDTLPEPAVECSHVSLGPGSVACNGNMTVS